jgi:hypothetical protein
LFTDLRFGKQLTGRDHYKFSGGDCMLGKLCRLEKWCGLTKLSDRSLPRMTANSATAISDPDET